MQRNGAQSLDGGRRSSIYLGTLRFPSRARVGASWCPLGAAIRSSTSRSRTARCSAGMRFGGAIVGVSFAFAPPPPPSLEGASAGETLRGAPEKGVALSSKFLRTRQQFLVPLNRWLCEVPMTAPRRRKRRPRRPTLQLDRFSFAVERTCRSYSFGVNRGNRKAFPDNPNEFDVVEIHGTLRTRTDRPLRYCEIRVYRSDVSLDKMAHDTESIGFADTRHRVTLDAGVWLPFDAFYSVAAALGRGEIREVEVTVRDMKRGRGPVDGVRFEASPQRFGGPDSQSSQGRAANAKGVKCTGIRVSCDARQTRRTTSLLRVEMQPQTRGVHPPTRAIFSSRRGTWLHEQSCFERANSERASWPGKAWAGEPQFLSIFPKKSSSGLRAE